MANKICFKCNKSKPLSLYYKHRQMKDGHLNKCIECTKQDTKNNDANYDFTEKGVIRVIYKTQRRNSKVRGHQPPAYTKEELCDWLYENGFKQLFTNWVVSGFSNDIKPSVDRIDDFKPYSFGNIRLVTWKENRQAAMNDRMSGTGTQGKCCKPLLCFDCKGNLVAEYVSYSQAKRVMGYALEYSIRRKTKDRKGYYWAYKQQPTV